MTLSGFPSRLAGIVLLLAGVLAGANAIAQTAEEEITQEYFIQQAMDEALLIRINAFEAQFESTVVGENGEIILRSGLAENRIVPVFQYIHTPKKSRQLSIEITSSTQSERSNFGLELTRLTVWDDRSNAVSRAYQLLSFGMQNDDSESRATWSVKIDSLISAGKLFHEFGMEEMRLWANYLAAHLIQYQLHDYSIVYGMTREILAAPNVVRLPEIKLAALKLQGAALIGLKRSGVLQAQENQADPMQSPEQIVLAETITLAETMGFKYEQAQALNASGIEYAAAAQYTLALEQFQRAVEIADSVGEAELATGVRERIVAIHATQGNTPASGEVLQEIETQLAEKGAGDELALNLLAQARLFIQNYRYDQALEVLLEALNYQNNSAISKQINFELARVSYETGRADEALAYLQLTGVEAGPNQQKRANPIVDSADALGLMANIYRVRGVYGLMRQARAAQGQYQPPQSRYLYDQALDRLATEKTLNQQSSSLFRQSHLAAGRAGLTALADLSLLQICALAHTSEALCTNTRINASYKRLTTGGNPRDMAEAMYLWAQILTVQGLAGEAVNVMDQLTREIHFFRHSLPGVLGGWYMERHQALFDYYLGLHVNGSPLQGGTDDIASLLALSRIRTIEGYSAIGSGPQDTALVRALLAKRAEYKPGQSISGLNNEINQHLAGLRDLFNRQFAYLSRAGIKEYLQNLSSDEVLLTYHLGPSIAHVWVGQKGKFQRHTLANPGQLYKTLDEAREGLADNALPAFKQLMDRLGQQLIAPVADSLAATVFWIPAGPLLGFPVDALRFRGHYLVESHNVVHLMSFPANPDPAKRLATNSLQKVFLAGHPQDFSSDYATRLDTSNEIRAIADIFVGPGLRIIQGTALLPDEFQVQGYTKADLVHLEMPASIDLAYPGASRLELSGTENGPGRTPYWSRDIQVQAIDARLVFLSASTAHGKPRTDFRSRVGLVNDFIDAGAHSVIASFWANGGKADEAFLVDFYNHLDTSGHIASSLAEAKRQYIRNNQRDGLYGWAGYQLFAE